MKSDDTAPAVNPPHPAEVDESERAISHRLRRFLTVGQIADAIQVSERHVRRLITDGTLPAYHLSPGIVRIAEDDYLAYLASKRR